MRISTGLFAVLTIGWTFGFVSDATAAWNNVFHSTCRGGRSYYSGSFYAPPAPACCPEVKYVQRTYYQPVTTYKMETVLEPVTTYKTSYYWEPFTKTRYTSYYDPCTRCTQTVAEPVTAYRLRSQCSPVQSYVQRCRMVPVTEMRKSYYLEAVTVNPCDNPCNTGVPPIPGVAEPGPSGPGSGAPRIGETGEPPRIPPAGIQESYPKPSGSTSARFDRIASLPNTGRIQGMFVRDDRITPKPNSRIRFVSLSNTDEEVAVQTDGNGSFSVNLPAGEYSLRILGNDGKFVHHSTIKVNRDDNRIVTLVSR
jgi:hypothetical protein